MQMFISLYLTNITIQVSLISLTKRILFLLTGPIPLNKSKTSEDPFENGQTDVFEIENINIGKPTKIK